MPFLQLTIALGALNPTAIEDALFAVGASAVTLQDAADDPILEPGPGETPLWPTVNVNALFAADAEQNAIVAALHQVFGSSLPTHHFDVIEDRAWEREWLKDFRPMQFGKRLWICPGGMTPPTEAAAGELCLIHLDPGLAFGTGTHPTTALCLEWLDGADVFDKRVIDYGCGSGILGIAALKLGAREVIGIDNDPQALIASRDNAERNEVATALQLQDVASTPPAAADIVIANILAGPLDQLAPLLASLVRPNGHIVLSGILHEQADGLAQRYSAWFDMASLERRDDWMRLVGRKRTH